MDRAKAEEAIKAAWIAGAFTCAVTLVVTLIAMNSEGGFMGFSALNLVDAALVAGLAFGVARKSRVCAVLLLAYFVVSKLIIWSESGKPQGLVMAAVLTWFFIQGVRGTFALHSQEGAPAAAGGSAPAAPGARRFKTREEYEAWKAARLAAAAPRSQSVERE